MDKPRYSAILKQKTYLGLPKKNSLSSHYKQCALYEKGSTKPKTATILKSICIIGIDWTVLLLH